MNGEREALGLMPYASGSLFLAVDQSACAQSLQYFCVKQDVGSLWEPRLERS